MAENKITGYLMAQFDNDPPFKVAEFTDNEFTMKIHQSPETDKLYYEEFIEKKAGSHRHILITNNQKKFSLFIKPIDAEEETSQEVTVTYE